MVLFGGLSEINSLFSQSFSTVQEQAVDKFSFTLGRSELAYDMVLTSFSLFLDV